MRTRRLSMSSTAPPPPAPPPAPPCPPRDLGSLYQIESMPNKCFGTQFREACHLVNIESALYNYTGHEHEEGLLQNGPQCGLVALKMACDLLLKDSSPSVEALEKRALDEGFTRQGEMFSCCQMAKLTTNFLPGSRFKSSVLPILALRDGDFLEEVFTEPRGLLLIPYDADQNQFPTLKKGRKAHWALCIGFLKSRESAVSSSWLLVRQSKSRRLFVFSIDLLVSSNSNLDELGWSYGKECKEQFVIDDPKGLKNKMVYIKPKAT